MRDGDLPPAEASALLVKLTSLLGNVLTEMREADMVYNVVLLGFLDTEEAANRAKVRAAVSPEFQRAREAKDTHAVLVEMIRSLRQVMRSQGEEMRLTR